VIILKSVTELPRTKVEH